MNILIVDEHIVFREILESLCSNLLGDVAVTCVADGASAIRLCQSQMFSLPLLDLQLPDIDSFDIADAAAALKPDIPILALSSHCNEYNVFRAEKRRVRGFVDKRVATISVLHEAITRVAANSPYFSPSFLRLKSERIRDTMSFDKILSERELEVLALVAAPFSNQEIAAELGISPQTVEKHRFNILRKLGLHTTAQLVRFGRRRGIVRCPEQLAASPAHPPVRPTRPAACRLPIN